ncbi:unnamed protein product [Scytosiphon promiscuus]
MREFWVLTSFLLVVLRRALTVAWIRLNKFLSSADWLIRPVSDFRHKVVLIGDGFAEGVGDWVVMGGTAGVTRMLEREAGLDDKVRTSWQIINRGRAGTVSADWLPSEPKSLFNKKVRSTACKDAEIFVVALGTMDVVGECVGMPVAAMRKTALDTFEEDEICDTVKNIREICDALRADGKKVIVCNVMTTGAGLNRLTGTAKRLNRQLALYAKATAAPPPTAATKTRKPVAASVGQATIADNPVEIVKMNNPRATRDDGRAFDGLHLNARGYRAFSGALYEALGPMLVAVEWRVWKSKLAGGLTTGLGGGGSAASTAPVSGEDLKPKSKMSKKAD